MQRRTFAKTLVGALVAVPALSVPTPAAPVTQQPQQPFKVLQKVRWLRPPTDMPTIGHVIGLQQRFVSTELEEIRYLIDFETLSGSTKLWLGAHELEPVVASQECLDMLRAYEEMEPT